MQSSLSSGRVLWLPCTGLANQTMQKEYKLLINNIELEILLGLSISFDHCSATHRRDSSKYRRDDILCVYFGQIDQILWFTWYLKHNENVTEVTQ